MSADNWATCPNCLIGGVELESLYGKVSINEFLKAKESLGDAKEATNFREDYEIGMRGDGTFYVSYNGQCTKCGFKHVFKQDSNPLEIYKKAGAKSNVKS